MIKSIQGDGIALRFISGFVVYTVMALGARLLVLPKIRTERIWKDSLLYAGIYGLVIYTTFDFTNYALFKNWKAWLMIREVFAGTSATVTACALTKYASQTLFGAEKARVKSS